MFSRRSFAALALAVLPLLAPAQEVWITKNTASKFSVDLTEMRATAGAGALFVQTVQNDLLRSGWFTIATPATFTVRGTAVVGSPSLGQHIQHAVGQLGRGEDLVVRQVGNAGQHIRVAAAQGKRNLFVHGCTFVSIPIPSNLAIFILPVMSPTRAPSWAGGF